MHPLEHKIEQALSEIDGVKRIQSEHSRKHEETESLVKQVVGQQEVNGSKLDNIKDQLENLTTDKSENKMQSHSKVEGSKERQHSSHSGIGDQLGDQLGKGNEEGEEMETETDNENQGHQEEEPSSQSVSLLSNSVYCAFPYPLPSHNTLFIQHRNGYIQNWKASCNRPWQGLITLNENLMLNSNIFLLLLIQMTLHLNNFAAMKE